MKAETKRFVAVSVPDKSTRSLRYTGCAFPAMLYSSTVRILHIPREGYRRVTPLDATGGSTGRPYL